MGKGNVTVSVYTMGPYNRNGRNKNAPARPNSALLAPYSRRSTRYNSNSAPLTHSVLQTSAAGITSCTPRAPSTLKKATSTRYMGALL